MRSKAAATGVRLVVEVQALETDDRTHLGPRLHPPFLRPDAAQHVALQVACRDLAALVDRAQSAARARSRTRVERSVARISTSQPARRQVVEEQHGERVWLLARSSRRRSRRARVAARSRRPRQRSSTGRPLLEELELPRLAEEVGLVRADASSIRTRSSSSSLHELVVGAEAGGPARAAAARGARPGEPSCVREEDARSRGG